MAKNPRALGIAPAAALEGLEVERLDPIAGHEAAQQVAHHGGVTVEQFVAAVVGGVAPA
ncbi:MAG: hypothetical protein KFB96_07265 [Thiocapsa sp.]|nr:MAG: hypothetical protein KFB96_07265 [Thiocapsa sp.]